MRRRSALILGLIVLVLGALIALGGAGAGMAGKRTIDPFTATPIQSQSELGKHAALTVFFKNSSVQTITQATLYVKGSGGATFDSFTASRGTCAAASGDPSTAVCPVGHLASGATVTISLRFNAPPVSSGATSMTFDTTLLTNERGGDPGSQSHFHPTTNPLSIALQAPSPDKVADVFGVTGDTTSTDAVTTANLLSTKLTTPGTGSFEPVSIDEGPVDPTTCGQGVTPKINTVTLDAPGTFTGTPLTVVLDAKATSVGKPITQVQGCHNGHTLPLGCPATIPAVGCLKNRQALTNENGVLVYRLTMVAPSNGKWGMG